jgi:O-antigen biosynthesis protein WbqV
MSYLKRLMPLALDIAIVFLAMVVAFWLRLDQAFFLDRYIHSSLVAAGLYAACCAVAFFALGTYRGVWRSVSFESLRTLFAAVALGMLAFSVLQFLLTRFEFVPRAIPLIALLLTFAGLLGPRMLARLLWEHNAGPGAAAVKKRIPVLVVGEGARASSFIRETTRDPDSPYHVVGLVGTDRGLTGRRIHHAEVMGSLQDLAAIIERQSGNPRRPSKIVVADEIPPADLAGILDIANAQGLTVGRTPRLFDLAPGHAEQRVLPISVGDLLNRPEARVTDADRLRSLIEGQRVLVTGAAGSIGSELTRQIAAMGPEALTMLDSSEFGLYEIDMEIATQFPDLRRNAVICDVRDRDRVFRRIAEARPQRVFHAAALKHVPLMEAQPCEAVLTNLGGTINVVDASARHGVETVILVSTDKAVNPTNVMGTTKRAAEVYAQALDLSQSLLAKGMRLITVRFGNVLGSNGSVVPLFRRQIEAGGPVTVTHPEMRRFFMSIPEAVQLILEAMASGTANAKALGRILVLDMGEPVKIVDLARQMIRLSGKRPDVDIGIEFVGMRPGEKLYEEVAYGSEGIEKAQSPGLLIASAKVPGLDQVTAHCQRALEAARSEDVPAMIAALRQLVPEAVLSGAVETGHLAIAT